MDQYQQFLNLHQQEDPLLIANVWNASSAKAFEKIGYKALGTSSSAVANTLGYEDGEEMSFDELLFIVKRILANISVPLTVDIEGGYSREPREIVSHIEELYRMGVVGVNLEDSFVSDEKREMHSAQAFATLLNHIHDKLSEGHVGMFLNIRTDAFLLDLQNPVKETLDRIHLYNKNGASGVFVPLISNLEDISSVVKSTQLPINVLSTPALPSFDALKKAGVKRISMGGAVFRAVLESMNKVGEQIMIEQSFKSLYS